jgi:hypothetical protein
VRDIFTIVPTRMIEQRVHAYFAAMQRVVYACCDTQVRKRHGFFTEKGRLYGGRMSFDRTLTRQAWMATRGKKIFTDALRRLVADAPPLDPLEVAKLHRRGFNGGEDVDSLVKGYCETMTRDAPGIRAMLPDFDELLHYTDLANFHREPVGASPEEVDAARMVSLAFRMNESMGPAFQAPNTLATDAWKDPLVRERWADYETFLLDVMERPDFLDANVRPTGRTGFGVLGDHFFDWHHNSHEVWRMAHDLPLGERLVHVEPTADGDIAMSLTEPFQEVLVEGLVGQRQELGKEAQILFDTRFDDRLSSGCPVMHELHDGTDVPGLYGARFFRNVAKRVFEIKKALDEGVDIEEIQAQFRALPIEKPSLTRERFNPPQVTLPSGHEDGLAIDQSDSPSSDDERTPPESPETPPDVISLALPMAGKPPTVAPAPKSDQSRQMPQPPPVLPEIDTVDPLDPGHEMPGMF